jgi:hypothetical protein
VGAPGQLQHLPPGAQGPARPAGRARPALGGGPRQAQGAGAVLQDQGRLQQRHVEPVPRRREAPAAVRGRRTARSVAPAAERDDAAARRAYGEAGPCLRGARADRADAAPSTSRCGSASGWRSSARTARASRTSCGCSPPAVGPDRSTAGRRGRRPAVAHRDGAARGAGAARVVRADARAPELAGARCWSPAPRHDHRDGLPREPASRALDRYELARRAEQAFDSLSGGQQAGSRSCCWSSSGPRCCCSTSPPTTSTCTRPRRWRTGLAAFEGHVSPSPTTAGSPLVRPVPRVRRGQPGPEHPDRFWDEARVARER